MALKCIFISNVDSICQLGVVTVFIYKDLFMEVALRFWSPPPYVINVENQLLFEDSNLSFTR